MSAEESDARPFSELSTSGLLWLINRTTFHPHGRALALEIDDAGNATGWHLLGDGSEPWSFTEASDEEKFRAAQATLKETQ